MGMQNGSNDMRNFLIHALELKLRPFKVHPYVCIGKPRLCNVLSPGVRCLENR